MSVSAISGHAALIHADEQALPSAISKIRDLTKLGRERRRERHKTIDLITKYNDFMLECNHLAAFPSFSFVNRT